jgi:serine/threonine protein kinase
VDDKPPTDSEDALLEALGDEFAQRLRRGESPSISKYADANPKFADEIRELLPSILMMEQLAMGRERQRVAKKTNHVASCHDPERLGDYAIVRRIGQGGMGIVYEAVHQSLDRRVAVKVLPPQLSASQRHVARFVREAKAAARLHHTNIVPVFGVGEDKGTHFYVMQLIDGRGLDSVLDQVRTQTSTEQTADGAADVTCGNDELSSNIASRLLAGRSAATRRGSRRNPASNELLAGSHLSHVDRSKSYFQNVA